MRFDIEYSPDAVSQLQQLRRFDQVAVADAVEKALKHEPSAPSRHRKRMRSKIISTWELRIGDFRVYYDVDDQRRLVEVRAIGIKVRERVYISGEEVDLG